jgi:hypothetical protein
MSQTRAGALRQRRLAPRTLPASLTLEDRERAFGRLAAPTGLTHPGALRGDESVRFEVSVPVLELAHSGLERAATSVVPLGRCHSLLRARLPSGDLGAEGIETLGPVIRK